MVKDPQAAPFTIAIVGGGLAGLTLSIGLTRYGISHKIYESAECFAEIGAGIAMGPNAVWALALIDHRLRERYDRCATYNEREDQRELFFDFRQGMASDKTGATKYDGLLVLFQLPLLTLTKQDLETSFHLSTAITTTRLRRDGVVSIERDSWMR